MGLLRATAFRFGQGYFGAVFNFYFNSRQDQKRARQIHALERVAILFLGLRHDARNAPSCFKSSTRNHETTKGRKDDTNIHVLNSCVESSLLKQNPTLIYLRNVKSFVFRAGRKVPHCQKWDCYALPLFALDRAISGLFFNFYFNSRQDQKRARQIHALERVAILFWGCDMMLGTHPAASKVRQKP